ncbi:MAG: NAD(P)-dependent oxidoreductase [Christensenella hongkongensis]|uniref:NAD(P)-dependent oxidoreductase n=1 Tax=Christensenella hongkongensis TaxID=270498 RepID=UPI00267398E1|nr:NAD(P)-dependent oxidoreductase [Christensenella hongkongensis]MDY3003668.1 NAD(P)-dependent oxidoreductase [Christensenella hongkongensis]
MRKVGFIGLGNMGKGICKNIIEAGNKVTVFDANREAMQRFEGKAVLADDVMQVFHASDVIFLSLPNSNIVENIMEQFFAEGVKGKVIVDTSTSYPMSTKKLAKRMKEEGGTLVDAPLMAGPDEAEAGELEIVVGGDKADFESLSDLFGAYCKKYSYVGESGSGHLAKLAINFCSLSEALIFAQVFPVMAKLGMKQEDLFQILNCEALANWVFDFYSKKYVNKNYRLDFALALGLKDLSYMKRLYEELNIPGFILDGALDLCRVSLQEQKEGEVLDFSYPCQTMYEYVGLDK